MQKKLDGLSTKINDWIKNLEDEVVTINQDAAELKQKKAFLTENLKRVQRKISKTACFYFHIFLISLYDNLFRMESTS